MAETAGLDPQTRAIALALSDNPTDIIQGQLKGYLEDFIRVTVGTPKNTGFAPPPGFYGNLGDDLSANTGEYVYTDAHGVQWLYGNGAAVSQATYADLYAFWGANKWGADSGGNFLLPDARGRGWFFCGTHANADLGDNDGAAEGDRQAKHSHGDTLTVDEHTHVAGTLVLPNHAHAVTDPGHYHDFTGSTVAQAGAAGAVTYTVASQQLANTDSKLTGITVGNPTTNPAIGGSTGGMSGNTISGLVGTGVANDAPAHIFLGSLLIAF